MPFAGGAGEARGSGLLVSRLSYSRGARPGPANARAEVRSGDPSRAFPHGLSDISFAVPRGRLLAVVGPSGAGKSTLLSLLAGFERPTAGEISFDGARWTSALAPDERGIGMSFDDAALHEHLTVRENIDSAALPRGEPSERRRARVASLAGSLALAELLDRRPAMLSAGERRRVSVARAFVRGPGLALLDEPFANLDRANRFTIRQLVRELQRSTGCATIVVTHDPTDALAIADEMLVLVDGRVRALGRATEIADNPPDLACAQLVDDLGMHVVEFGGDGRAHGCVVPDAVAARLAARMKAADATGALAGIRPWQIALRAPDAPSIALEARVGAIEPAGLFSDVVAIRSNGRTLRARVERGFAQELPIGSNATFHMRESDLHLFAPPWPGRRIP